MRRRVPRTPNDLKRRTLGKAWRSFVPPTPDKAAGGLPLMYQYGENVVSSGRECHALPSAHLEGYQENCLRTVACTVRVLLTSQFWHGSFFSRTPGALIPASPPGARL
jgi:hypothetical protein